MATVIRPRRRRGGLRRSVPLLYLALAMLAAVLVLPTALRPPPDPTTESGAISPDAPPDDNPEQLIQSNQQAAGGGAGAAAGGTTTVPTAPGAPPTPVVTTTTPAPRPASGQCFGKPPRQIESVYSAPCAPGFVGDNGGATDHNVFPNEVRLGFWHILGSPPDGPVPKEPQAGESAETRTMRVLMAYVNKRFETYGRRISFYGLPSMSDDPTSVAASVTADETYKLFGTSTIAVSFCFDQVRRGLVAFCEPNAREVYERNRPGLYSLQMEYEQLFGFGSEFLCKKLKDKPASFGGGDVNGKVRRIAVVSDHTATFGIAASKLGEAYARECGGTIVGAYDMGDDYATTAPAAIAAMRNDNVTTVVINTRLGSTATLMAAAAGWGPEWITLGQGGMDGNVIATALPKDQTAHLFGLSGNELAKEPQETECARAYHSIDPDNDANTTTCSVFWFNLVFLMNGIQMAGPKLTRAGFEKAMVQLGHRYDLAPWAVGGGFGPGDWSYMDAMGEIWFDSTATDPTTGGAGAYRWTNGGARRRRGQLTADISQLFRTGISQPPPGA